MMPMQTYSDGTVGDLVDSMVGLDGHDVHDELGVSCVFYNTSRGTEFVASDYAPEKELVRDYVRIALRQHGVDYSSEFVGSLLGYVYMELSNPSELYTTNRLEMSAYDKMFRGLRNAFEAWSRHRRRFVFVAFHAYQYIENTDVYMPVHIHVIYERNVGDEFMMFVNEVSEMIDGKCTWDAIDVALGLIQLPEYVSDEEIYDDMYDDMDDLFSDEVDEMDGVPFEDEG